MPPKVTLLSSTFMPFPDALVKAIQMCNHKYMTALLETGTFNINHKTNDKTPLFLATELYLKLVGEKNKHLPEQFEDQIKDFQAIIDTLISKGADPKIKCGGKTPQELIAGSLVKDDVLVKEMLEIFTDKVKLHDSKDAKKPAAPAAKDSGDDAIPDKGIGSSNLLALEGTDPDGLTQDDFVTETAETAETAETTEPSEADFTTKPKTSPQVRIHQKTQTTESRQH